MHGKWTRLMTLILCLTVVLTPLPTGAEDIVPADAVIISEDEPSQEALPSETAEISTDATEEQAPSPTADDEPDSDDEAVDVAETPQPQDGADESEIPPSSDEALSTDETPAPLTEADNAAAEFAQRWVDVLDVGSQQDDYHRALLLYDSLIYNYTPGSAASAIDALTQRNASAPGYALSYELLLRTVGIECATVFEGEYAWNLACLDGAWTHIDVYADDVAGHYGFHFGLTDAAMAREHHWEGFPASTDTQNNYFVREQHYAAFTGSEDLSALLSAAIETRVDAISLYSAGDAVDITHVLGELDSDIAFSISSTGLYHTIHFDWPNPVPTADAPVETEHPIVSTQTDSSPEDVTPAPEALPTAPIVDDNAGAETEWPIVDEDSEADAEWPIVDGDGEADAESPIVDDTVDVDAGEDVAGEATDQYVNLMELVDPQDVSTVSEALEPASIVPSETSIDIGVKETKSIADWKLLPEGAQGEVSYTSKSPKIADVSETGDVTGKTPGSTQLEVALIENPDIKCLIDVTVAKAPSSITISGDRKVLGVGEQMQVSYKLSSGSTGEVTFSIPENQQSIATVTSDGLVSALSPGKFTLNAKTYNGKKAKAVTLEVKSAPTSIELDKPSLSMGLGDSYTLNYTLTEGSAGKVNFVSDTPTVATVNADTGMITAVGVGSARIKASAYGKVEAWAQVNVVPAPDRVELSASRDVIGIGEKLQLTAQLFKGSIPFAADTATTLTYKSSKTSIATVDETGMVTGKKAGSATITVAAYNSTDDAPVTASVDITVKKAPSSITISGDRKVLGVGEQMQVSYKLSSGSTGEVTFSIPEDQQSIATVTSDGLVSAHNTGKFTLNAKTYNNKKAKAVTLEVKPAPTSIELDKPSLSMGVGDSYTLNYTLTEGSAGKVSFESDDTGVVTVDADTGMITAVGVGTAHVKASAYGVVETDSQVNVVAAPNTVTLEAPRDTIGIGEKLQLKAQLLLMGDVPFAGDTTTLTYKSSKTSIATVDETGMVTGKKAGSASITVAAYNSTEDAPVTASVDITVKKAPSSITISGDRKVLGVGEQMQVSYKLSSGSTGEVTFSIPETDQAVATVTPEGLITAISPGKFTLNAKTYNNKKAKAVTLEVKPAPTSITLDKQSFTIGFGDSYTLNYTLSEGSAGKVSFESDNTGVVTVDADTGTVTAVGVGMANVKASAYGRVEATAQVQVVAAPDNVKLEAPRDTIGIGEQIQLDAQLMMGEIPFAGDTTTLTYKSSKTSIATVDETGLVTGKKAGSANITVTAYNSTKETPVTASVKLTVQKAPGSIAIQADRTVLGEGEQMQLGFTLPKGTMGGVTFTVPEGQDVGTVTPEGSFTARHIGTVEVTATTFNNKSKSLTIEVRKAPIGITLVSPPTVLGVGASVQLHAQLDDPESAGKICYRITGGQELASVDENGIITANAVGSVTVEAYTYVEGMVQMAFLNVVNAPETLTLPENSITLGVGDTYTIAPVIDEGSAASFTYSTSKKDKAYASVSPEGVVTASKVGKSTITVATHNKLTAKLTVNVKAQPKSIAVDPAELTLGVDESVALNVTLSKNSATTLSFESDNTRIATVGPDGTVTAEAVGNVNVNITTHNGLSTRCTISVVDAPKAINIDEPDALGVGEQVPLEYTLVPEYAHTTPQWEIVSESDEDVIAIKDDMLYALAAGTATLRCTSHVEGIDDELEISVFSAPTGISFEQEEYFVELGGTLQLQPTLEPAGSSSELSYTIEHEGFFEIDEHGLVTPIECGSSRVKATTYNKKYAITTVTVVDPDVPAAISLVQDPPARMDIGDSFTPEISVYPETANPAVTWTETSKGVIVELNPQTGAITAKTSGHTTIEAVSVYNPEVTLSYGVTVTSDERCLVMPSQYLVTSTGKINSVYSQINDVRDSAYSELEELCASGYISEEEKEGRRAVITRAFEMYHFAWKPDAKMPYWKAANSEGGRKDFKTDYIYFGIPYTQSSRQSYPQWAIDKGYYKDSGKGYYTMQTSKFQSRKYPGSDCSSFASMAVWGYNGKHRSDNTTAIASASYYKTLSDKYWQDLRPGDLLCYGGHHVAMFLYYANQAKTQFVIIEQGGGSGEYYQYCNTISTSIRDQAYYKGKYKIRRVSTLDMTFRDRV